jgi:hypothetical protein
MRFRLIEDNDEFPNDGETCWYWDTGRRYGEDGFIAVQTYCDRDPGEIAQLVPPDAADTDGFTPASGGLGGAAGGTGSAAGCSGPIAPATPQAACVIEIAPESFWTTTFPGGSL